MPWPRQDGASRPSDGPSGRLAEDRDYRRTSTALRWMMVLVGLYLGLSLATFVALVVLHGHASLVTTATWYGVSIVAATALLMSRFARRTARGQRRPYLRLRVTAAIVLATIVVALAIPGDLPAWLKVEQGACGLLLLGVVVIVNSRLLRTAFAERRLRE
jgi:peptidoglycan/LPS O-acetylase OafA/YrhL